MNGKKAFEGSVFTILGIIYVILGGAFVVLGSILYHTVPDEARMTGSIFGGVGFIFLILGVIFLVLETRKKRQIRRLIEAGQYIEGEVTDYTINYRITVNNRNPYIAIVRYVDLYGTTHIFKSRNIYQYPDPSIIGRTVKVYVEDDSYTPYYVDMSEILSQVVEH